MKLCLAVKAEVSLYMESQVLAPGPGQATCHHGPKLTFCQTYQWQVN